MPAPTLEFTERVAVLVQREVGRLLAPIWIPLAIARMRFALRWRIEGVRELRREYRRLRHESVAPLLICANHLTMADSFLVAWALGSPLWYAFHYASLPWNTPERTNFAHSMWSRVLLYLMKCVPVTRGGDRGAVAGVFARIKYLMSRGEVALIFPEGGRSRTGRVDAGATTYGVGRIVKALPGCRVLCVYLRGERQQSWSDRPVRGDRFRVAISSLEPKSERSGLRGSIEIARQILARLAEMERRYFDDRQ